MKRIISNFFCSYLLFQLFFFIVFKVGYGVKSCSYLSYEQCQVMWVLASRFLLWYLI